MNTSNFAKRLVILTVLGVLAACGGDSSEPPTDGTAPPASVTAVINAAGGTVTGPDGVQVVIPAGALDQPTTIGIARSAVGAPASLPEDYTATAATPIYEFTPHDLVFNTPVTIRVPTSSSAPSAEILMASPGEDWQVTDARISGGFAEWQRNSFSWGMGPFACAPSNDAPYSSGNPDPYPCSQPRGYASASATPTTAIMRRTLGSDYGTGSGSAGSWDVNQASTVRLSINYQAAPDCENPRAKLLRWNPAVPQNTPGRVQTLFDGPVVLTTTTLPLPGGGTYVRGVGSTSHDVSFSHLDNGTSVFGYSFSCNRPFRTTRSGGDLLTFVAAIPVPSVTYAIGGTVSGLTGTGLALQNNSGDNRAVTADGAFTFATAIGVGAPYAVSVLTQPAGQTCTVQNGSGTANANVTNVAVGCVASPVGNWGAAVAISAAGKNAYEPALGASIDGYTTLAWQQYDADQSNGYASRFDPANGWQGSELFENLATNTSQSLSSGVYSPRVTMGANQRAHIVFGFSVQPGSYHTGMARYTGSAWESNMLTFGGNSNDAALSFTGDGNTALMMYSQYDGVSRYAIRSQAYQYGNGALASPSPDGGVSPGSSSYSAAAALGSSDAVGTWIAQSQFVYVNRFNGATQTWGVPVNLNASSTGNAYPHAIAGNAGGNAAVVWLDLNSGYRVYASRLSGATWSTPVTLATQAEGAPRNFSSYGVSVATGLDTSGNAYFAWGQEDLASPFTIRLYVSRCAIGQPMSACESRIQMDTRNDRMGRPGMAVAPNGDVWVAWVARTAAGSEVRIRQRNSTGWSAVVTLGSSSGTDGAPSIAIDGLNRVTVAWEGADSRIYVARHQ